MQAVVQLRLLKVQPLVVCSVWYLSGEQTSEAAGLNNRMWHIINCQRVCGWTAGAVLHWMREHCLQLPPLCSSAV